MRHNSTIQDKKGKCLDCPPDSEEQVLIAKRCSNHYKIHRKKVMLEKQKVKSKVRSLINTDANTEMALRKFDNDLKEWFAYHMEHSAKRCENCGADLSHYNMKALHNSQHHIIEKSAVNGCPSVATELLNHMVLGYWCGCHGQWHSSYHNAQKMKCFPIAKIRFDLFKHLIAEDERHKIPECFLAQINQVVSG